MSRNADFVVGNTYRKLQKRNAKLDKTGKHRKIHDWILFVDIIKGNPDIINSVVFEFGSSFSPSSFACMSPVEVKYPDGETAYRFKTRQQTYGPVTAKINIRGCGGTVHKVTHRTVLETDSENLKSVVHTFTERNSLKPLKALKIDDAQKFGIELELTSDNDVTEEMIANVMNGSNSNDRNNNPNVVVIRNWAEGRATSTNWKLVPDSSIVCSTSSPDCNRFELVSPILMGGNGLSQINTILKRLNDSSSIVKVNKSMGYHLHINVESFTYKQLVKVCQNFIKYEDAIDTLMPRSRRTGSEQSDRYFKSNRQFIASKLSGSNITNKMCHDALKNTNGSMEQLIRWMNGYDDRYFKLNLQNISTGRQPTIEFRQHSATANYAKVSAWVRFCVAFCLNSAKLAPPTPFSKGRSVNYKIKALFQYVIKDRALRDFYMKRREELAQDEGNDPCCTACVGGNGTCAVKRQRMI